VVRKCLIWVVGWLKRGDGLGLCLELGGLWVYYWVCFGMVVLDVFLLFVFLVDRNNCQWN
jgi:hypothetical protein